MIFVFLGVYLFFGSALACASLDNKADEELWLSILSTVAIGIIWPWVMTYWLFQLLNKAAHKR